MPPIRQDIREEFSRLIVGEDVIDKMDAYKHLTNSAFKIISDTKNGTFQNNIEQDADLLFQMTALKCHSILSLIKGFTYTNPIDRTAHTHIIDTFSIWSVVRSQYEAYCTFNNLYIHHKDEEQKILYNLWALSGLNYRQQFGVMTDENEEKIKKEKESIKEYIEEINSTSLYKVLPKREQDKIFKAIKNRKWQYFYENQSLEFVSWKNMAQRAGVKATFFDDTYAYLSLCSHPSNVAVFQFKEIYMDGEHYNTGLFALSMSRMLTAFLIRDYCTIFPNGLASFNTLPETAQLLINSLNRAFRSNDFVLNDIEEHV